MVIGQAELHARFKRIPKLVREELTKILEQEANKVVSEMNALRPIPEIEVAWTWGEAPEGALTIGRVGSREFGKLVVTIYATARSEGHPQGFNALAAWFEFGTAERFHKSGKYVGEIYAAPYFWPVYRANKKRILARLRRAVNRVMRKA